MSARFGELTLPEVLGRLLDVRRSGAGRFMAHCPLHNDRTPSLSVRAGEGGRVLARCFGCGATYREIMTALGLRSGARLVGPVTQSADRDGSEAKPEAALRIWKSSQCAVGTPVETYLRSRRITIPVPPALRFAVLNHRPSGREFPAMVALVQDRDGKPVAIHRTFLKRDGTGKADVEQPKMMLGPCAGGTVRLGGTEPTVVLCEGIETGLSVLQALGIPVWAALGTSGMRAVQFPGEVKAVTIAADADGPGETAATETADRLVRQGLSVRIAVPERGDFNDILLGRV